MNQDEKRIESIAKLLNENGYELFNDYNKFGFISIICTSRKRAFWFLELYSISLSALLSESKMILNMRKISLIKRFYRVLYFLIKLFIFKIVVNKGTLIIVSSKLRKNYLESLGYRNLIVLKNKPIDVSESVEKNREVFLSGNLRSIDNFSNFIEENCSNYKIKVVGVDEGTQDYIQKYHPSVPVLGFVDNKKLMVLLSSSKYAVASYDGYSTNQILSSSSKLFEIFNSSCIPIINSNPGLIFECLEEDIPFIIYDDKKSFVDLDLFYKDHKNKFCRKKLFEEERLKLKEYLEGA